MSNLLTFHPREDMFKESGLVPHFSQPYIGYTVIQGPHQYTKTRNNGNVLTIRSNYAISWPAYLGYPLDNEGQIYVGFMFCYNDYICSERKTSMVRLVGEKTSKDFTLVGRRYYLPDDSYGLITTDFTYVEFGYNGSEYIVRLDGLEVYRETVDMGGLTEIQWGRSENYETIGASDLSEFNIQDLYINNGDGNTNNTFWGVTRIDFIPVALDGSENTGFIAKNGGSLVDEVSEYPSDKGATYVEGVNPGSSITFKLARNDDVSLKAITCHTVGSKMATSDSGVKLKIKEGSQTVYGEKTQYAIGDYSLVSLKAEAYHDGSPWDWDKFDNSEFGVELVP